MASTLQDALEGKIDFEGQKWVDSLLRRVLVGSTVLSFVLGFGVQSLRVTFASLALSTVLLVLAIVPPWPVYRRHPVKWLPVVKTEKKKK